LGSYTLIVAPMGVKFGTEEGTFGLPRLMTLGDIHGQWHCKSFKGDFARYQD